MHDAALPDQLCDPCHPWRGLVVGDVAHPHERVVHVLGRLRLRPGFGAHAFDGGGVERAQPVERPRFERAAAHDGLRAALLQRRVVEERVQLAVEDPARERRGLRRVHRDALDRPVAQPAQDLDQTFDVRRFDEAVVDRLPHQRVIHRDLQVPRRQVLGTRDGRRKRSGQEIGRAHAQDLRRHRFAVLHARQDQRARRVPPPARLEHRLVDHGLRQRLSHGIRVQVVKHFLQREAVLRAEREDDGFLVRRGLQARSRNRGRSACAAPAPRRG